MFPTKASKSRAPVQGRAPRALHYGPVVRHLDRRRARAAVCVRGRRARGGAPGLPSIAEGAANDGSPA